jgi:archaemetzincin
VVPEIHILNGSLLASEVLGRLEAKVEQVFGVTTKILRSALSLDRAYDQSRGQHNSTALLALLIGLDPSAQGKRVLIVDVDLYIPVLTFVFGEAQLGGMAAIVSTHRLQNQFYGLPHDDDLMLKRLEKEVIHELGHTFGLFHCRQFECVMRSSTYVEEIDLKRADLCDACRSSLKSVH